PTTDEIENTLNNWLNEIGGDYREVYGNRRVYDYSEKVDKNSKFYKQYTALTSTLNDKILLPYRIHPQAIYYSRLLDTKSLPEPQNSKEVNEKF
ncbi:13819_t:CDS:1, partial [Cetraspora pellucida]